MLEKTDFRVAVWALVCAVVGGLPRAHGQADTTKPLVIPRTETTITIDGNVSESEWRDAERLPLAQQRSNFGAPPDVETEILLTHTEEALYLACRCYDPGEPTITSFERDGGLGTADGLRLILDTFNDEENAVYLAISPTGNRTDAAISNDLVITGGGVPFDLSWNTYWYTEVRRSEEGWFAEMRIPASSLRFETEGDRVVMGLTAYRWLVRKNENYVFPAISQQESRIGHMKPSNARDVVFNGLQPEPPLRVTPYVLGGLGRQSQLNDAETRYEHLTDWTYDAGLDIKYGLTSNFTLDLTLNTDFAQVEADNQQVNLTRFPLFFPEKRRFFLERSSNFAFDFGGPNRLFYSRRIGLHQGQQIRILGGARVVGRRGKWDLGALAMQTAREPELGPEGEALPSENFSAIRLQREVLNQYSQVGGIVTSRIGMDGSYNLAYGLDGTVRPFGDEYLTAKWAQTFTDRRAEQLASFRPARIQLLWERRTYEGLSYDLRFGRAGDRYQPGMGFALREEFTRLGDQISYGWLPGENSAINQHQLTLQSEAFLRNGDGSLQSLQWGPAWSMNTSSQHSLSASLSRRVEDLRAPFALTPDIAVPAGRHGFYEGELTYGMPGDYRLRLEAEIRGGGYFDGRRGTAQISPTWNPSRFFQMDGFYQINRVVFPDRDEAFTAHISRIRLNITPNVEHSVFGFIQHNSAREVVVANVRYRYNPREGNDFYLVYNEQLNTSRSATGTHPRLPRSGQRAVLLKYNHTFNF